MIENTRLIPLTQGKHAIVDAADYEWLSQFKWYARRTSSGHFYAQRSKVVNGNRAIILIHRVIMGEPIGLVVDHINRDPCDNRRSNLRLCTRAENTRNGTSRKGASSKYIGVGWNKSHSKWQARIMLNRQNTNIGFFLTEAEAAAAYDAKARIMHGEFASLNFT